MASKLIVFQNSAASAVTFSYTVSEDSLVKWFVAQGLSSVLSTQPDGTQATLVTSPAATVVKEELLISNANVGPLDIPVPAGRTLFVAVSASKGNCYLILEPLTNLS
jgi:hypothetical protein